MPFITLTTDFGTRQGSDTVLHGAIYNIAPDAVITDLSHEVKPQDIREANFVVNNSVFFFPPGETGIGEINLSCLHPFHINDEVQGSFSAGRLTGLVSSPFGF